jgi:hypothetical protein
MKAKYKLDFIPLWSGYYALDLGVLPENAKLPKKYATLSSTCFYNLLAGGFSLKIIEEAILVHALMC